MKGAAKRVLLEVVGWVLVLAGIAALVLPGPGLLLLAAGLFVLSQQYEWAERRVDPILDRALIGAATGVESLWKVALSVLFALGLGACGVLWIKSPPAPDWWPLSESLWLPGGLAHRHHADRLRGRRARPDRVELPALPRQARAVAELRERAAARAA